MPTIFERIEKRLANLEQKAERKALQKIKYQRLTEQFRGSSRFDKLQAILKIWGA